MDISSIDAVARFPLVIGAEFADWHRVMAFASIYVLPILAIFLLLQRNIVSGLTAGALK